MKDILDLIGRIIIGVFFIIEAIESILYFNRIREIMIDKGFTWHEEKFLIFSILLLLFGGTLILIGYRVKFGGTLLLLYWIPLLFFVHNWWSFEEPERRYELLLFVRSFAIAAGVLHIIAHGSGKYSVRRLLASTRVPKRFRNSN